MRRSTIASTVFAAACAFGAPLASAAYPPIDIVVTAPASVPPGTAFTANVTGCTPGGNVTITLVNTGETDVVVCTPEGTASTTLTSASSGPLTVTAYDQASQDADDTVVAVTAVGIPETGSESSNTLQIAGIVGATGLGLVGIAAIRRRRPTQA